MRKILIFLFFISNVTYSQCVDVLTLPDPYYQCALSFGGDEYNPVCGCDFITYRNECAAIHWGALLFWTPGTICGNFHIDFRPTAVSNNPAKFQAFIKNPNGKSIPISIYIYDTFGKLHYTWDDVSRATDGFYPGFAQPFEIPVQNLPYGIFNLVVVVNGEKQYIKFGKVTP